MWGSRPLLRLCLPVSSLLNEVINLQQQSWPAVQPVLQGCDVWVGAAPATQQDRAKVMFMQQILIFNPVQVTLTLNQTNQFQQQVEQQRTDVVKEKILKHSSYLHFW